MRRTAQILQLRLANPVHHRRAPQQGPIDGLERRVHSPPAHDRPFVDACILAGVWVAVPVIFALLWALCALIAVQ